MSQKIAKAYLFGDVHLDARFPDRERAFCRLLDTIQNDKPDAVFMLGDIFEFWFGYKNVMFAPPIKAVAKIAALACAGIPVTYIVGNHDFRPGPVFTDYLGIQVAYNPVRVRLGEFDVYISHGDEINTADRGYLFLKSILRSKTAQLLFHIIPASWAWHIGRGTSDTSRKITENKKDIPPEIYHRFLADRAAEGIGVVIHGHTHLPGITPMTFDRSKLLVINSGHWFGPGYYVLFADGRFELKEMPI
jgi:UDP-2,3-diacylglucosamine hydrolase